MRRWSSANRVAKKSVSQEYHQKLNIIFDGIDRRYFNNRNNDSKQQKEWLEN